MAGLLDKPTTDAPEAHQPPEAPQPEAAVRACAVCAQPLAEGQDWCLECGSAQPGRLGGRPGWRAALSVLAVTAVLVGGAAAAAYAALTTEAQREASSEPPPAATPQVAQPPAQVAPEAGDDEDTPSVDAPESEDADVPEASGDAEDGDGGDEGSDGGDDFEVPSGGSSGGVASGGDASDVAGATGQETAPTAGTPIDLPKGAAAVYNPYGRPATGVGDPARAIDGKASTAWEAPVDQDGTVMRGVVVSLDETTSLSDLEFRVNTPGLTVEVYATRAQKVPPDILDARWEHPASQRDAGVTEKVALDGRYRHVLLWVTEQPADTKAAIAEIKLFD